MHKVVLLMHLSMLQTTQLAPMPPTSHSEGCSYGGNDSNYFSDVYLNDHVLAGAVEILLQYCRDFALGWAFKGRMKDA